MKLPKFSLLPHFFAATFLCLVLPAAAETLSFTKAPWQFEIDRQNGALLTLKWNGETISRNPAAVPAVNWGPAWRAGAPDSEYRLLSHTWDANTGALTLNMRQGDWLVDETVTPERGNASGMLTFAVRMTYAPAGTTDEPAKFDRVNFTLPISREGRYFLPGKREFAAPDSTGELAALKNGDERRSAWGIPPLLIERTPALSLIFMPEYRNDIVGSSIKIAGSDALIRLESRACGWAYPGEAQEIGPFYLSIFPGNQEDAFTRGVRQIYDTIHLKAVSDTPEWFRDAVIYSFQPGGTIASGWKDLGGFNAAREELLPRLRQLGFNTLWILPVEEGHIYWPRDYYKLQKALGSEEDFKALIDTAHRYGMKVLMDCVPHGGTPEGGKIRGNKPWELIFDEAGNAYGYWCFDFGNPDWQKYIAGVVDHNMKTYGIDGCRIDAVIGNHYVNWRKKDFPSLAKTPKNVPADWWRSSLEKNGGKLPPLPYERGSLGCRRGGLEMLKAIRNAVERNKTDGVILAEVDHAPYMQDADAIFNFPLASTLGESATRMPATLWIERLARWLDELNFANPRGTRWLQYFGSHDHLSPFGWVGVNQTRALMAVSMLVEGIPMVYHDQDVGLGVFLKKMIEIRQALPELRRGDGRYATAGPGIFSAVRRYRNAACIGLVNVSPDPATAELQTAVATAISGDGRFAVWTPDAAKPLAVGTAETLKSLKIDLKPWSHEVLAFRPEGEPSPFPPPGNDAASEQPVSGGKISMTETDGEIQISAPAYSLVFNRADGRIIRFSDASGNELLRGAGFLTDDTFTFDRPPFRPETAEVKVVEDSADHTVTVTTRAQLSPDSTAKFTYHCAPDAVTLDAELAGTEPPPRAGFAFAAPDVTRWQVSAAEGLLDDFFTVRHAHGTPSQTMPEGILYYRLTGTPVMWQAETNPLAFDRPSIRVFSGERGVEFSLRDPLNGELRNAMVLDKLGEKPGWHAAFFWRDVQPYPQNDVPGKTGRFSLVLKPVNTPLEDDAPSAWTQIGGLRMRNTSQGWELENDHYVIQLQRCGGVVRSLRSKRTGAEVLNGNQVYTDRGFRRKWGEKNMRASSANDGETGVRIRREGEKLYFSFHYSMREPGRRWLPDPMLWGSTEYIFDGGADIQVCQRTLSVGKPHDTPAFLAWEITSDDWMSARFFQGGETIASGLAVKGKRPDAVDFLDRDGETMLRLSDIRYPANAPALNVSLKDSIFYIASLEGNADDIEPGKTYETALTLSVGDKRASVQDSQP